MKKKNKRIKKQMMELFYDIPEHIKEEYLKNKGKPPVFVIVEIYADKKYGAVARIFQRNSILDRLQESISKKEREKVRKRLSKSLKSDKPVDTSKWVKPDEESIRNNLIKELFALEILKEDSPNWRYHKGRAEILYSILHSHSPGNPQSLTNFYFEPYFESIMREFKVPEGMKHWNKLTNKKGIYMGLKNHRKWFKEWKERCLKNMIVKDPNPPKFVDIFTKHKLNIKDKKNNEKGDEVQNGENNSRNKTE